MPNWLILIVIGLLLYGVTLAPPFPPSWRAFAQWCGGLLAAVGLLLLVLLLLGIHLPWATAAAGSMVGMGLLLGAVDPIPANPPAAASSAATTYTWRYWLNLGLVLLSIVSVIGNFVTAFVSNGAWLGLTDITWHWVLVIFGAATALNTGFNHTPPVTNPPTPARLLVESKVSELRKMV